MAPSPATDWAVAKGKPARLLHAARLALQYYIVRVDAAPGVDVPGGSFVTVESGPHVGLEQALSTLEHPRLRVGAAAAQPACCDAVDRAGRRCRHLRLPRCRCSVTAACCTTLRPARTKPRSLGKPPHPATSTQAHVLPDIVWLSSDAPAWVLNQPVGLKPRLVVAAETIQRARDAK